MAPGGLQGRGGASVWFLLLAASAGAHTRTFLHVEAVEGVPYLVRSPSLRGSRRPQLADEGAAAWRGLSRRPRKARPRGCASLG